MKRGRKTGYRHSLETREKIRNSLSGQPKTEKHKESMSRAKLDPRDKIARRYWSLVSEYPEHEEFFEANKEELLVFLTETRTEKELQVIHNFLECNIQNYRNIPFSYPTSSWSAQEDLMLEIVDFKRHVWKKLQAQ